jgi:hypothetical protein
MALHHDGIEFNKFKLSPTARWRSRPNTLSKKEVQGIQGIQGMGCPLMKQRSQVQRKKSSLHPISDES